MGRIDALLHWRTDRRNRMIGRKLSLPFQDVLMTAQILLGENHEQI
jgi:hypothetical protein